jgi:hypothetical protein
MKNWFWLLLSIVTFLAGCAPGYYERKPGYQPEAPGVQFYRNPETDYEQQMRIWREGAGR